MGKRVVLLCAIALMFLAPAVSGGPVGAASRTRVQPGTYKWKLLTADGGLSTTFKMKLNADGTASVVRGGGVKVRWTQTDTAITVKVTGDGSWSKYTGRITANGFGTKRSPGTWTTSGGGSGHWYAVKLA